MKPTICRENRRTSPSPAMEFACSPLFHVALLLLSFSYVDVCLGQDYDSDDTAAPPPGQNDCDGIFLSYTFISRQKEYPRVKNVSGQSWAFKSQATILNAGSTELKAWKMFIGFQHREILVSVSSAVVVDGEDFPAEIGNGTTLAGYPQADLMTSIDTAGDLDQIQVKIELTGTQFGVKAPGVPMPATIRLVNDGFKCPAVHHHGTSSMYVCCKKDPKFKAKDTQKTKFLPRQNGDLSISYDVIQAYGSSYLGQVTIENQNPLGRLDRWNLTWEWMRGEFIYSMRGAYTRKKDPSDCIYGAAGKYYSDLDFSQVMSCESKPVISDLPPDRANDSDVGKLPYCCRNGSLLPVIMDESKSISVFQLQVYKLPPDLNRTALTPPQKWKINGILNPNYKCGPPIRVEPTEFPDASGLQSTTPAIASWQVICNITLPKDKQSSCCVSFSAYYNDSVIPCNTCSCGCEEDDSKTCNPEARALLLPAEALLVPFENRTAKAKAWAKLKHFNLPKKLPCPDNCGVSINWHINSDYRSGWTARITLFNWRNDPFEDWFTAVRLNKVARGFEGVYSFNGTKLSQIPNTIMFQGFPGMNYLMGETNGTNPTVDPRVPGKQQSVISFTKNGLKDLNIQKGDGFPTKVYFNGEECALPTELPVGNAGDLLIITPSVIFAATFTFILIGTRFHQ